MKKYIKWRRNLFFEQPTSCYPNQENVGNEYDSEYDLFEDESNVGHRYSKYSVRKLTSQAEPLPIHH